MRRCSKCGCANGFYKNRTTIDGFDWICKDCRRKYNKTKSAYQKLKEKQKRRRI